MYEEKENMGTEWVYVNMKGIWKFAPRSNLIANGEHILNSKPFVKLQQKHIISDSYIDEELLENGE